jgi:hypothetical protein
MTGVLSWQVQQIKEGVAHMFACVRARAKERVHHDIGVKPF